MNLQIPLWFKAEKLIKPHPAYYITHHVSSSFATYRCNPSVTICVQPEQTVEAHKMCVKFVRELPFLIKEKWLFYLTKDVTSVVIPTVYVSPQSNERLDMEKLNQAISRHLSSQPDFPIVFHKCWSQNTKFSTADKDHLSKQWKCGLRNPPQACSAVLRRQTGEF